MKKNILVTATGGRSVGSGLVHALSRSSSEVKASWNVIATDADPFAWGLYVASDAVLLPMANANNYIDELKNVIKTKDIHAIVPGSEPETNLLSRYHDQLGVPVITNRQELMPLMMDKFQMIKKITELGLPVIETWPVKEWEKAVSKYPYPFIIKPTVGTGGSKGLAFISNQGEIEDLIPKLKNPDNFCIQPYIGTGDDEYTVGILSDKDGNIIDSIVMKRKLIGLSLLDSRTLNGKNYAVSTGYSQGFFIKHERIQSFCEELAKTLKSTGPLNIQLRLIEDTIYVFEIHTRFSGTSPMRADVGFNEADILLRNHLYNEQFSRLNYQYDVAVIRAFEHVVVPISKMKN